MFRRSLSLVLTLSLLVVGIVAVVPTSASAATIRETIPAANKIDVPLISTPLNPVSTVPEEIQAIDQSQYYGRQQLVNIGNTALVYVYDRIAAGVDQYNTNIYLTSNNVSNDDLNKVLNYYIYDHPECFWFNRGTNCKYSVRWVTDMLGQTTRQIYLQYTLTESKAAIIERRAQTDARVDELLNGLRWTQTGKLTANGIVKTYWTPLVREQEIFSRLYNSVIFGYAANNAHKTDLTAALLDGEAQSAGIAAAFQYLMHQNGIECMIVRGTWQHSLHVWCMVKINGNWKMADPSMAARHPLDADDYFNFEYADMEELGYTSIDMQYNYFPFAEA